MAAQAFREAGFDAYSLAGGVEAWAAAGQPLEPEGAEVRKPPPAS
jgi:rhodanese-related sulfurtransferase